MWRSIGGLALLTLVWALVTRGVRWNDTQDDAAQLAKRRIRDGWKPLNRRDQ